MELKVVSYFAYGLVVLRMIILDGIERYEVTKIVWPDNKIILDGIESIFMDSGTTGISRTLIILDGIESLIFSREIMRWKVIILDGIESSVN